MEMLKNIFNNYDNIVSEIEALEKDSIELSNIVRAKAEELKTKWQLLYDKLIEIHFAVAKYIYIHNVDQNKNVIFKNDLSLTPKQVLVFSEKRADVIQYKYLYPLNIRLNEFAEQDAIKRENESEKRGNKRDIWFFLFGILIGFLPELASPWLKVYFPILEPKQVIKQKTDAPYFSLKMLNDSLFVIKIDSNEVINNSKCK